MRKSIEIALYTTAIVLAGLISLTIIVERTVPTRSWIFGDQTAYSKAIIVYDPDPFFNLDEQVCLSFGQVLGENNIQACFLSVSAANEIST